MAIFLIIHIIICIVIYLLMRFSVLKSSGMMMPLICMVPVWGVAGMLILEVRSRGKQEAHEEVGIEKLKINDEVYRSILMDEDPIEDRVVPLEEALLINDPATRRDLMMEVMYSNPDDYVGQLKEARMNDDTEVVHYAVTALSELQKEYELQFQELDWKMKNDPEDDDIIDRYLKLLNRYLASGIAEGNDMDIKLRTYSEMLGMKIEKMPDRLPLWKAKAETDLKIREYPSALEEIHHIIKTWDGNEAGYLLLIQYYSAMKSRQGIERTLERIRRKHIYLTPEGRRWIRFWEKDEGVQGFEEEG